MIIQEPALPKWALLLFRAKVTLAQRLLCMIAATGLVLGVAGLAAGCGKKAERTTQPQPATNYQAPPGRVPAPAAVQAPAQPKTLAVPQGANTDAVLQQLNRELVRWIVGHRRTPKSFEEFVSSAQLTVPPPPPGKRYVLGKDMKIVLK